MNPLQLTKIFFFFKVMKFHTISGVKLTKLYTQGGLENECGKHFRISLYGMTFMYHMWWSAFNVYSILKTMNERAMTKIKY